MTSCSCDRPAVHLQNAHMPSCTGHDPACLHDRRICIDMLHRFVCQRQGWHPALLPAPCIHAAPAAAQARRRGCPGRDLWQAIAVEDGCDTPHNALRAHAHAGHVTCNQCCACQPHLHMSLPDCHQHGWSKQQGSSFLTCRGAGFCGPCCSLDYACLNTRGRHEATPAAGPRDSSAERPSRNSGSPGQASVASSRTGQPPATCVGQLP